MGIARSLGVKWWQITTRRQGHRETVRPKIWTQEVLQSECIKSMPYVKTEAQFVQVFMNYKAPTVNYRLLFKRNMWKLSQQQWRTLCSSSIDSLKIQCLRIRLMLQLNMKTIPAAFWNQASTSDISAKMFYCRKSFLNQSWILGYDRHWRNKAPIWFLYILHFTRFFGGGGLQPYRDNPKIIALTYL